jgi:HTH-type transcriptional regulator/antitoxin HipB
MRNDIVTSGQLGPVLKQLRIQQGYSQTELGEKLGLSQERISKIETHPEKCRLDQILTVLMALNAVMSVTPAQETRAQATASASLTDTADAEAQNSDKSPSPENREVW